MAEKRIAPLVFRDPPEDQLAPLWRTLARLTIVPIAGGLVGVPHAECKAPGELGFFACAPAARHHDHVEEEAYTGGGFSANMLPRVPLIATSTSVSPTVSSIADIQRAITRFSS